MLGTPKPTLQWFKDDMEVFSSERLDIKEEEDGGNVIVREVRDMQCSVAKGCTAFLSHRNLISLIIKCSHQIKIQIPVSREA